MAVTAEAATVPESAPVLSEAEVTAVRRGVPDPGIALPKIAVPTVLVWMVSLAVWCGAAWLVLADVSRSWLWLTIPVHALVTFAMFTVLHESTHHAAGRWHWVNEVFGRLSVPFVAAWGSFPLVRYIHIEHHRNTNEDMHTDPDAWTEHGPAWQLPLRWLSIDAWYFRFYVPRLKRRPRRELVENAVVLTAVAAGFGTVIATGHLLELVLIYLIPQRIGLGILAWWFDWLPHHDLGVTAKVDRFRATRVRVGWEWLFNPLMFYQNYHLVHHIHPTIPFYRYVRAWKNTTADYLERGAPIVTAWGRELSAQEYRAWRQLPESFDADSPETAGAGRARFHRLRVSDVRRLTAEAVSVTFEVPDELRPVFRFTPGQHVVVRAVLDGQEVRRSYSICTSASSSVLRIAVKHVEGGRFSHYINRDLRVGAELEVLPPSGNFTVTPDPARCRHLVAVVAGSGITPVISILASTLAVESESRATLIYANRAPESTMFGPELQMLARQFEGRLRIVHVHSRAGRASGGSAAGEVAGDQPEYERIIAARLTPQLLDRLLAEDRQAGRTLADADAWYLCGPHELADRVADTLRAHGVAEHRVHRELFHAPAAADSAVPDRQAGVVPAAVTVTLDGAANRIATSGDESLLEAALRSGLDAPYSCTGGACSTCRAKLLHGTVHMEQNYVLPEKEVADGWILTCQARPTSEDIGIDYDR